MYKNCVEGKESEEIDKDRGNGNIKRKEKGYKWRYKEMKEVLKKERRG